MKVITLENITKLIEDKHGKQCISKALIHGDGSHMPGIVFIHNEGSACPKASRNSFDELDIKVHNESELHCVLLQSDLDDYNCEHPFIKSREALSGYLVIDNKVPTEDELRPYFYTL